MKCFFLHVFSELKTQNRFKDYTSIGLNISSIPMTTNTIVSAAGPQSLPVTDITMPRTNAATKIPYRVLIPSFFIKVSIGALLAPNFTPPAAFIAPRVNTPKLASRLIHASYFVFDTHGLPRGSSFL
jgi:hypothetical protein